MAARFVPVNTPRLDGNEAAYLAECIETGWVSSEGPFVDKFETAFADRVSRKHGIAVSNGSDALELALWMLELGPGDEVIMPAFTIISCASAITRSGAIPVLVDCDPHTWTMDPEKVAEALTPNTKAIMVVHIYGLPVDMAPILQLAEKNGLKVIEDAAEAIGLDCSSAPCGSFGDVSTFSFYANKHVTMGEGGFVATNDDHLAERARSGRNLCFLPHARFSHEELGWNMRITNLQAAVGLAQLERLDEFTSFKRRLGAAYTAAFQDIENVRLPRPKTAYAENVYWVYGVVLEQSTPDEAAAVLAAFKEAGIGTRPFFKPMHEQDVFRKMGLFRDDHHPVSEELSKYGFYIPSGLGMTEDDIDYVITETRRVMTNRH